MASTLDRAQLIDYKRAGVRRYFEIHDGYVHRTGVKFNCNTHVVHTCSCSFRLSCSTALQVMASTLVHAQLLDYTQAGVRHHLKSAMGVDLRRTYVKFNLVCAYVKRTVLCTVHSASVRGPFNIRSTSVQ